LQKVNKVSLQNKVYQPHNIKAELTVARLSTLWFSG